MAVLGSSCLSASGSADPSGGLAVRVAPLNLPGVTDADYTLEVTNGAGGAGDVVWARTQ